MALPQDRTIDVAKFPEQVRRFVDPKAPAPMKGMVARGLVPMKPVVLVCALHQLAAREGGQIAADAAKTVRGLPPGTLRSVASERLLPVVLDWLAELFVDTREVLQPVVLNSMCDTDTLVRVARESDDVPVLEIVANNQARLLTSPPLVEALFFNRAVRASTVDRVLDFAARNGMKLPGIPEYEAVVAAIRGDLPSSEVEAAAQDAKFAEAQAALAELTGSKSEEEVEAIAEQIADAEARAARGEPAADEGEGEKRSMSAAGRIRDLNVAQKVRLALMGNATERQILIRDTNKIVARAVIRSPAISDTEAMGYAKNKSLLEEVVSYIANNKKWTRHYQMKLLLVQNPKTPLGEALRFLSHLRVNDLRQVARSKGIPAPVAKAAKQLVKARMK